MTRKKLLFVAPTTELLAGGEISHFELLKAAKKRGYRLHVVVRGKGTLANELKKNTIPYTIVPFNNWYSVSQQVDDGLSDFVAIQTISSIIKRKKIDCVITNTLNMPWGALAASLTNTPHVWIVREYPFEEFSYLQDKYDFIKNFSNLVIANSKNLATYMNTNYQVRAKYFYSYVDIQNIKLSNRISHPRIVMVGHIFPRKNQMDLLKAVAILRKNNTLNNKVLLVGASDNTYKHYLDAYIQKHSLEEYIQFAGYNKNPYSLVQKNDIIVQTSRSESIGRTPVEAMKLGLIVIGADILGTKEAFRLGGGVLYKHNNPADLAKKITAVLADQKKYQKQAKLSQSKIQKKLSEKACHKNFFIELEKVLTHPNPQSYLQEISPYFASMAIINKDNQNSIKNYQKTINEYQYHLNTVLNSRSWKLAVRIKQLFRR